MGCEIEIKAHLEESKVESIINFLKSSSTYLGEIDKKDIYWSNCLNGKPLFRTRMEKTDKGCNVLFTSKPLKKKDYNVEYNVENEFSSNEDQWDNIIHFCKGLNLEICRIKYKTGFHFLVKKDSFDIHCEILNVKYLGWFVESEIVGNDINVIDKNRAESALYSLLNDLCIPSESIEPRGYNKLLKECGHELG